MDADASIARVRAAERPHHTAALARTRSVPHRRVRRSRTDAMHCRLLRPPFRAVTSVDVPPLPGLPTSNKCRRGSIPAKGSRPLAVRVVDDSDNSLGSLRRIDRNHRCEWWQATVVAAGRAPTNTAASRIASTSRSSSVPPSANGAVQRAVWNVSISVGPEPHHGPAGQAAWNRRRCPVADDVDGVGRVVQLAAPVAGWCWRGCRR